MSTWFIFNSVFNVVVNVLEKVNHAISASIPVYVLGLMGTRIQASFCKARTAIDSQKLPIYRVGKIL